MLKSRSLNVKENVKIKKRTDFIDSFDTVEEFEDYYNYYIATNTYNASTTYKVGKSELNFVYGSNDKWGIKDSNGDNVGPYEFHNFAPDYI